MVANIYANHYASGIINNIVFIGCTTVEQNQPDHT